MFWKQIRKKKKNENNNIVFEENEGSNIRNSDIEIMEKYNK